MSQHDWDGVLIVVAHLQGIFLGAYVCWVRMQRRYLRLLVDAAQVARELQQARRSRELLSHDGGPFG